MKLLSQHVFLGLPQQCGPCLLDLAVKNRKPDSLVKQVFPQGMRKKPNSLGYG